MDEILAFFQLADGWHRRSHQPIVILEIHSFDADSPNVRQLPLAGSLFERETCPGWCCPIQAGVENRNTKCLNERCRGQGEMSGLNNEHILRIQRYGLFNAETAGAGILITLIRDPFFKSSGPGISMVGLKFILIFNCQQIQTSSQLLLRS
jgi:hypothetical protein